MRKLVVIMMFLFISSVPSYGVWETAFNELLSKGKALTKIGQSLGIISSKDGKEIRKTLQLSKTYSNSSTNQIIYKTLPEDIKNEIYDLKDMKLELETVLDSEIKIQGPSWMEVNLIDFFKEEVKEPPISKKTKDKQSKVDSIIDSLKKGDGIGTTQMTNTIINAENLKEQQQMNEKMGQVAATLKNIDQNENIKAALDKKKSEEERGFFKNLYQKSKTYINSFSKDKKNNKKNNSPVEEAKEFKNNFYQNIDSKVLKNLMIKPTGIFLTFFLINIIWRYILMLKDDQAGFPIMDIIGQAFLVGILIVNGDILLDKIYQFTEGVSSTIKDASTSRFSMGNFFSNHSIGSGSSWWSLKSIFYWMAYLCNFVALMILNLLQRFILMLLSVLAPLIFCMSLLPIYNFELIKRFFVLYIQVCSWSMIEAVFIVVLGNLISNMDIFNSIESTIFILCLGILMVVKAIYIPKIASIIFGGGDLSPLSKGASLGAMLGLLLKMKFPNLLFNAGKGAFGGVNNLLNSNQGSLPGAGQPSLGTNVKSNLLNAFKFPNK